MQWQEVRTIYPDQYVLLEILDSHTEDNIQYVDEVVLVRAIQDPNEATKELLKCKNNNIVYHTGQEKIAIELRKNPFYKSRWDADRINRWFAANINDDLFQRTLVNNRVIDTGAAHSLLSSDIVSGIGIKFENGDKLVRSFGIGGDEYSFRKRINQVQLGNFVMKDISIDFGIFHEVSHINGLVGLDILKNGEMIIDLHRMEMFSATSI